MAGFSLDNKITIWLGIFAGLCVIVAGSFVLFDKDESGNTTNNCKQGAICMESGSGNSVNTTGNP